MTPNSNYSAPEAKSSANFSSALLCEVTLPDGSFEELSSWLDDRLVSLEAKFADFCTPKSLSSSFGR